MSANGRDGAGSLSEILDAARQAAEQLQLDNDELRRQVADLQVRLQEAETSDHGTTLASLSQKGPADTGDAPEWASERARLVAQIEELSQEYSDLERQNSNYLSLYVASSQIHATLVFEDVLRIIQEIIINLIGADLFAIYLINDSTGEFRRVACEGQLDPADEVVPDGNHLLSRAVESRSPCLEIEHSDLPSGARPLAVLPLLVGGDAIGTVVIFRLLMQKEGFDAFDMELFGLLSAHAATALMSSLKFRRLERRATTLQGLLDLFKNPHGAQDFGEG